MFKAQKESYKTDRKIIKNKKLLRYYVDHLVQIV